MARTYSCEMRSSRFLFQTKPNYASIDTNENFRNNQMRDKKKTNIQHIKMNLLRWRRRTHPIYLLVIQQNAPFFLFVDFEIFIYGFFFSFFFYSVVERELNVPLPLSKIIKKWNNLLQEYKVSILYYYSVWIPDFGSLIELGKIVFYLEVLTELVFRAVVLPSGS